MLINNNNSFEQLGPDCKIIFPFVVAYFSVIAPENRDTILTLSIRIPELHTKVLLKFLKGLLSVASDLSLHCLGIHFCPNTLGYTGIHLIVCLIST